MTIVTVFDINNAAVRLREGREWLACLQSCFELHPAVISAIRIVGEIDDKVLLQWPHRSVEDKKMLAYTRSEEHGEADRQTRTTTGKYLRAAFPTMKDNVIRDLVYEVDVKVSEGFRFVETSDEMVNAVQEGPYSCMQWDDADPHPYQCYAPRFGWSMAIRERDGNILSRALVYAGDACSSDKGCYVRAYGDNGEAELLKAWLDEQGIEDESSWPRGAKLAYVRNGREPLFPYIDGNRDRVDVNASAGYMTLSDSGDYTCNNSDGTAEQDDGDPCEHCDDNTSDEDRNWVGIDEETMVCDHCVRNYFTLVRGGNGYRGNRNYHVHEDQAIEVDGDWYDKENLPREVVELHDGSNAWEEESCHIGSHWYRRDDPRVCYSDYEGDYLLCADAWKCEGTGQWYPTSVEPVEIDGDYYHEDDVPEGYLPTEGSMSNDNQEELRLEA